MLVILTGITIHLPAIDPPPVIGLCIEAPSPENLEQFLAFMENDLGPGGINALVLRVDYRYRYKSHPELREEGALSEQEVKKLVDMARKNRIRLIPQINLLGHQSWAGSLNKLLEAYPEFDEIMEVFEADAFHAGMDEVFYIGEDECPIGP